MLRRLIEAFEDRVNLPIEIKEVRAEILNLGIQDKIILSAEELDTGVLKGTFYQWHESPAPYADPLRVTLIVYPQNVDIEIQRVICAKELIHVCDANIVKTHDPEAIESLAKKLVGPFETPASDLSDLMAAADKFAQYQSLNLLFPKAARVLARERIASGAMNTKDIADWAVLPLQETELVLAEEWERISELIIAIGNGEDIP